MTVSTIRVYPLRRRLTRFFVINILVTGFLVCAVAFAASWNEMMEIYDAQLSHTAKILTRLTLDAQRNQPAQGHLLPLGLELAGISHYDEENLTFRIWQGQTLLLQSVNAKHFPPHPIGPQAGYADMRLKHGRWRVFVFHEPRHNLHIEVAERYAIRYEIISDLMVSLAVPFLIFILVATALGFYTTRQILAPLDSLSDAVNKRNFNDLEPITADLVPDMVAPLFEALNLLLNRLHKSIRHEREFTNNAAHELRTPLAALKTQAQVLQRKKTGSINPQDMADLLATIDRATHLVDQMLKFARMKSHHTTPEVVDLSQLVSGQLRLLAFLALDRKQIIEADITPALTVMGHSHALEMLCLNVVDNALKYSPDNSRIHVSMRSRGGEVVLQVTDQGPGIPAHLHHKVFERFYRLPDAQSKATGSGLGLAIAALVAQQHNARIELADNTPHGLILTVYLPQA